MKPLIFTWQSMKKWPEKVRTSHLQSHPSGHQRLLKRSHPAIRRNHRLQRRQLQLRHPKKRLPKEKRKRKIQQNRNLVKKDSATGKKDTSKKRDSLNTNAYDFDSEDDLGPVPGLYKPQFKQGQIAQKIRNKEDSKVTRKRNE